MTDLLAVILSFLYVGVAIGLGTFLRKWRGYSSDFTRKFIHIAVGMIVIPTVLLFKDVRAAIIPPAAFVIINFLDWRFGILKAMQSGDRSNLGTVYFPISFIAVLLIFWDRPNLAVAAMMPLTWGDAFASVIGLRLGRHAYTFVGNTRTIEGTITLFIIAATTTFVALILFPPGLAAGQALMISSVTALAAGIVEALSPFGIDNLTIPAITIVIFLVMV